MVRDVTSVSSLSQCAARCGQELYCNSFSFRFSTYQDQDNCLLSGLNTSDIYPSSDLVQDPDWDIWQLRCRSGGNNNWNLKTEASKLANSVLDAVSAVSSIQACVRRCQDMEVGYNWNGQKNKRGFPIGGSKI